jgi:hypothetical protein
MGDAASRACASTRCSVRGSGVVWRSGASQAPSTPTVPTLTALCPSAVQIWRQKLATLVLPLVPVTATAVSGPGPNQRAAGARKGLARVLGEDQHRVAQGVPGEARALRVRQDGHGASRHRVPTKEAPWAAWPGSAAKRWPGAVSRLSSDRPATRTSPAPAP